MSGITYVTGQLTGMFLECVMFGIFIPLLISACYIQWERYSTKGKINYLMAFATVFFGLGITTNFAISLNQALRAILSTPPGAKVFMSPGPRFETDSIVWFAIFVLQTTLTDIVIAHRMYHIYAKNFRVCIIPWITIPGVFVSGCAVMYQLPKPPTPHNIKLLDRWSAVAFSFSLFNSLFMTTVIAFRLWSVHRQTVNAGIQVHDSTILRVMRVLVESAGLWTIFSTSNFFSHFAGGGLSFVFLAVSGPAVGICFCLIIVRLGHVFAVARDETWHMSSSTPASHPTTSNLTSISFRKVEVKQGTSLGESEDYPMGTLDSQKQEYVNDSDLPEVIRASVALPTPV